jgi:hypothetical protein
MLIGEVNSKKVFGDTGVQADVQTEATGCQHELEFTEKEIQAVNETAENGMMTDPIEFSNPTEATDVNIVKSSNAIAIKPVFLGIESLSVAPEPPKLTLAKKKLVFKAENSIDLEIYSNMPHRDSFILKTKFRKDDDESESFKLDQTIISDSDDEIEVSFSNYSFENKASKFRNSRLFRKLTDLELKNLHIHSVFRSLTSDKDKQYVSSKRMNKIALYVFRKILVNGEATDLMTMVYEYFSEKTKRDAYVIAMLRAVYAYCQVRESGIRTKIDILIKFIPFKMINMINTYKEIFRGLYYTLDE